MKARLPRLIYLSLMIPAFSSLSSGAATADPGGYLGTGVCAGCHQDIAKKQRQTNMALTWRDLSTDQLPANYSEAKAEGPDPLIHYAAHRTGGAQPLYRVQMPGQPVLEFPVEALIGGTRHGVTFLFRIPAINGAPLPRAPLIEGRYIHSVLENGLALELGFPEEKPVNYETGFGRVLTPKLEKKCLECHPAPRPLGARVESGVACESCHGPGQAHLAALRSHSKDLAILNPAKLPVTERWRPCSQCHEGSGFVEDPLAVNLLISDQITGLKNSECWRQSGGQMTCMECHDPHQDLPHAVVVAKSEKTCLKCHGASVTNRAALCPVNRSSGCVGCHLPNYIRGAFHLADHWIRVHDEQKTEVKEHNPAWRTTLTPKHLYLREVVSDDKQKASAFHERLTAGESFFDLARANSIDRETGANGGYMGDFEAARLDPAWSAVALKLQPGEISDVAEANGKYVILQRMPRNFRYDAEVRFDQATNLRKEGKQQEARAALLESLKIYPHFLRALTYLGISFAETGNPGTGAQILSVATRLYPRDLGAHLNLALAYAALGNDREIPEYQRVLEIEPDYVTAYLNWGGALYDKGRYEEAIKLYRKAIDINPINASLHYSLSVALERVSRKPEAEAELTLAGRIDPKYAASH